MEDQIYRKLAERNGWVYSVIDGRPYFMKDGKYATPTEETSTKDKMLLASAISEGSSAMARLILTCWNNGIKIAGPCSGIRSEHAEQPKALHFGFTGEPIYDFNYFLDGKELTTDEANIIFEVMSFKLQTLLEIQRVVPQEESKKAPQV